MAIHDTKVITAAEAVVASGKGSLSLTKRAFDLGLALILLPFLLPLIAFLALLVSCDGAGAFFGHTRVGKDGKPFKCWKLRSMVPDAKERLEAHLRENPAAAAEWARDFKLTDDLRITRLGRILRKTSLDELPQIWNVLKGEMSFVGPRPVTREELAKYRGYEWCYLSAKPGITGLWQVSGRNDVDYSMRVQMDVTYVASRSLAGDIAIIYRTAGAILKRTGR